MRRASAIGLLAATILIASSLAPGLSRLGAPTSAAGSAEVGAPDGFDCRPHPPILIEEETGPRGFVLGEDPRTGEPIYRPGSGVVDGIGTEQDPYVIEGWCLRPIAGGVHGPGPLPTAALRIAETDAHVLVQDNRLLGYGGINAGWGALFWETTNVTVQDNLVRTGQEGVTMAGIVLWGAEQTVVRDNDVDHNKHGIALFDARDNEIAGNVLEDNWRSGVSIRTSDPDPDPVPNQVANNTIRGSDYGVEIREAADVHVVDNEMSDLALNGMYLSDVSRLTLAHNRITDSEDGIHASHAADLQIEGNEITGTGEAILISGWEGGHEVTENNIEANTDLGLNAKDAVSAPGNWWGCPDGPEDEACDDVSGITVEDWLSEPNPDAGPR